jgi:hypothetical protein
MDASRIELEMTLVDGVSSTKGIGTKMRFSDSCGRAVELLYGEERIALRAEGNME